MNTKMIEGGPSKHDAAFKRDDDSIQSFTNPVVATEEIYDEDDGQGLTSAFSRMKVGNILQLYHSGSLNPFNIEACIQDGRHTDDNEMNATSLHIKYPIEDPEDYELISMSLVADLSGNCTLLRFKYPEMSSARLDDLEFYQTSVEDDVAVENEGNKNYQPHQARWQKLEGLQYNEKGEEKRKVVKSVLLRSPKNAKGEHCALYNMYWQGSTYKSTITDQTYLKKSFHPVPWEKNARLMVMSSKSSEEFGCMFLGKFQSTGMSRGATTSKSLRLRRKARWQRRGG